MAELKTYSEMIQYPTYEERLKYLSDGMAKHVGEDTFGYDRYLNQMFYTSPEWKKIRRDVILRDQGCDLGSEDHPIPDGDQILIHHMNPITKDDIINQSEYLMDPEYLISTVKRTHNKIHYESLDSNKPKLNAERSANDTCPWRKSK